MPHLSLVPFQLSFPGDWFPAMPVSDCLDSERDARDGVGWLNSVHDYLMWRAGDCWRKLHRAGQRQSASRWEYLEAAKLITDILSSTRPRTLSESLQARKDAQAQAELDIMRGAAIPPSREEIKLMAMLRPALVAELMRDPLYTDARRLNGLAKRKLARMVVQSRQRRAAMAETVAAERRSA